MLIKIFFLIFLVFSLNSCSSTYKDSINLGSINLININGTKNSNNYLFKEHLKRIIKPNFNSSSKLSLTTSIIFEETSTLSAQNLKSLNKTIAIAKFEIYDLRTSKLLKSGVVNSSPIIGSTSSSLYSNEVNSLHIKERLNKNLALKLSRHIKMIIRKLK